MEVIARKAYVERGALIFATVMLTLVMIIPVYILLSGKGNLNGRVGVIVCLVIYLALMAFFAYLCIDYHKTPKDILLYDGEQIISSKGSFSPSEIVDVSYDFAQARASRYGSYYSLSYGKLHLTIWTKTITYDYVDDLENVYQLLNQIIEKNKRKENDDEKNA